ncbi:ppsA [Symbiodinium sp. CCMP2592]|nr:ppsA [Symbiodinium sp. CCMP2592]
MSAGAVVPPVANLVGLELNSRAKQECRDSWSEYAEKKGGLPEPAQEKLKKLCSGFELQIVKCKADTDPVRNLCKGRAKVMVRYNPGRDGAELEALVQHLEAASLTVET